MFGKLLKTTRQDNKVHFKFEHREGIIEILTPTIINVFSALKYKEHFSRAIDGDKKVTCDITLKIEDTFVEISTSALIVKVYDDFKVDFYDLAGKLICQDYRSERKPFTRRNNKDENLLELEGHAASKTVESNKIQVLKTMLGKESFYGFGETTGYLNKRGYEYEMWNSDNPSPHVESFKSLYKSIPFFITHLPDVSFGIFFDNTFKSFFNMGKENSEYYCFGADDGNLDYYFIYGDEIKDVLKGYTYLTGTTPLPQKWALGYQQCRWSYPSEERIKQIAKGFRENDIPCDVLYLDIDYMDGYRVFTWNNETFPDPKRMLQELKSDGFKIVTIVDPGVKKDKGYEIYEEGLKKGYFATDKDGVPYVNAVWPGDSLYPDFSDEKVRNWWAANQKIMIDAGVSGIWNDMNEPASFNGPLPDDVQFKNDGRHTDHTEVHNIYGHLMSKATNQGIKDATNKRPFVVTRACYAGIQKYSTVWTGDNQSFWEHLRMSIPMLLNLGMSGVAFCGTDVGGFSHDCTAELLSRWVQVGCFTPLFRNHSGSGTRDQEPWTFDKETLDINRKYIKLRYKLIPYIYDLLRQSETEGLPVMRPLFLHYPNDLKTYEINDQFLVGENIMVAPILQQGQTFRAVYLPEGEWIDYWTNEELVGGKVIIKDAPLDTCPIFIKKGSVIPFNPEMNYVGEKDVDQLTLNIYPGNGEYQHYQDDGESYEYKISSAYDLFNINLTENEIKISKINSGYSNGYKSFKIVLNQVNPTFVVVNGTKVETTIEDGKCVFEVLAQDAQINF